MFPKKNFIFKNLSQEKYDVVVCSLVLHHILKNDVDAFINNIFKYCKTGGTLFVSFLLPDGTEDDGTGEC